jgi:hypothetical protein
MSSVRLQFHAPGASVADAERGAAAAMLFLQRAGVSPEEAVAGDLARAMWGDSGLAPLHAPTPVEVAAAEALDGALESALMVCYRGRSAPLDAMLQLVRQAT